MVLDAAYLFMGSKTLEHKTNRKIFLDDERIKVFINFLEQVIGRKINEKYYITAEADE